MSGNAMGNHTGMHMTSSPYLHNPVYRQHQMESMESTETPAKEIEELFEKVETYSKTTFELAKLKSLEVTTIVVTSLVSKLTVAVAVAMFLIVLNIGIAIYLGELLGKAYYGYFIVALYNLVFAVLLQLFLHPMIRKSLGQAIIKQALQ
jgi:hypothetical protein